MEQGSGWGQQDNPLWSGNSEEVLFGSFRRKFRGSCGEGLPARTAEEPRTEKFRCDQRIVCSWCLPAQLSQSVKHTLIYTHTQTCTMNRCIRSVFLKVGGEWVPEIKLKCSRVKSWLCSHWQPFKTGKERLSFFTGKEQYVFWSTYLYSFWVQLRKRLLL